MYQKNIVGASTIHLCSSQIERVLNFLSAVSLECCTMHFSGITLTAPKVVGTEN